MVIDNCHVDGCSITSAAEFIGSGYDNGDKVGEIIGYMDSHDSVINCSVKNTTIQGYRDIGGIAGCSSATISNCTVDKITLIQDLTHNYKNYTTEDANGYVGYICGRGLSGSNHNGNTSNNVSKITTSETGGA